MLHEEGYDLRIWLFKKALNCLSRMLTSEAQSRGSEVDVYVFCSIITN